MKLNLTYVNRTERTSKNTNRPFTSLSIKATQYGDKFLSGFGNKENADWKEGIEVEVAEVKEVSKDGKIYLNFEMPKREDKSAQTLENILNGQTKIVLMLQQLHDKMFPQPSVTASGIPYPEYTGPTNFDPKPDDGLDQISDNDLGF